jgi:ubiquinone/menaquinone biosynthesis C-methylase UbiE
VQSEGSFLASATPFNVGDATSLKFPDSWTDIVIVQGGLHHLPGIPDNFNKCLNEIVRILKPDAKFIMVEPWLTPFLGFVHWCCQKKLICQIYTKLYDLKTMIHEERETYFDWLSNPQAIIDNVSKSLKIVFLKKQLGKIYIIAKK